MAEEPTTDLETSPRPRLGARPLSNARAWGWGLAIFLYFAVASVWLVSFAIEGVLADIGGVVADLLALALWAGVMVAGMWGLREAQKRGFFR